MTAVPHVNHGYVTVVSVREQVFQICCRKDDRRVRKEAENIFRQGLK